VILACRSSAPRWTLAELAERLQQTHPELHLLPVHPRYGLQTGFYVSTRPLTMDEAVALPSDPDSKDRWQGVALCQQRRSDLDKDRWVSEWGDGAILLPDDVVLFGDPEIVQRVADTLPTMTEKRHGRSRRPLSWLVTPCG
jgi:hypothetical protein